MELLEVIRNLCSAPGVSGCEGNAASVAEDYLRAYAPDARTDSFHNVIGVVNKPKEGQKTILLDAHIDEIGLVVTHIDELGFLKVTGCGGVDRRLILGQSVTIFGKVPIKGIVSTIPPHLSSADDSKKVPEIDAVTIDIGMNKEEAQQVISLGDRALFHSQFSSLMGNRVSSRALDDRAGVAAILRALDLLKGKELPCGLTVLFSSQEETGEKGAEMASYRIAPDIAVAVDVSFAATPDATEHKCGKMGNGVMIGIAPSLTKGISQRFAALAEQEQIPYQLEVMGGNSGTNADVIGVQQGGVQTGLLSIPLKYMHTPVEVVDLNDIESVAQLLACYLEKFGA